MEKIEKRGGYKQQPESTTDLFLKWGNKKRLRCVRVRDADDTADPSFAVSGRRRIRRKINSGFVAFSSDDDNREPSLPPPSTRLTRNSETATTLRYESSRKINSGFVAFSSDDDNREPSLLPPSTRLTRNSETATTLRSESSRKSSPEKEDRLYTTRGCAAAGMVEKPKMSPAHGGAVAGVVEESSRKSKYVWPKLYIALTSKEKEEDFMAMKGCKPPHRPKKSAKIIQRTLLLVSPGAWLTDMCQERYEVREKKSTKKRPTGLKAMGSMESDSE